MAENIKRIGIITFHDVHNFGAMLQAAALQTVIDNIKPDSISEIIDYSRNHSLEEPPSRVGTHLLYAPGESTAEYYKIARMAHIDELNKRQELFIEFKTNHMKLSDAYAKPGDLSEKCNYDLYVSGGDQIWNTTRFGCKVLFPYMLGFTNSKNKISYGTGMSPTHAEAYELPFDCITKLKAYKKFMVREKAGADTLKKYFDTDVDIVIDPSLLLTAEEYAPFVRELKCSIETPFIFAYIISAEGRNLDGRLTKILNEYAKKNKCKMYLAYNGIPINTEFVTTLTAIGPCEWLWLVQNAKAVIATSFHAIAYSIVYNRPFIGMFKDGRKETLLDRLGVSSRLIESFEALSQSNLELHMDFTNPNLILDSERSRCKALLRESIDMCLEK